MSNSTLHKLSLIPRTIVKGRNFYFYFINERRETWKGNKLSKDRLPGKNKSGNWAWISWLQNPYSLPQNATLSI